MLSKIKTPQELMKFLDNNITYGVISSTGEIITNSNDVAFQNICNNDWRTQDAQTILQNRIGHCYDQVEIEREWFEINHYNFKTIWILAYQNTVENSGCCHAYLVYEQNNCWHIFEHADFDNKGIHSFKTLNEALRWQAENQKQYASSIVRPQKEYEIVIKEYAKPPKNLSMTQFFEYIDSCPTIEINQ